MDPDEKAIVAKAAALMGTTMAGLVRAAAKAFYEHFGLKPLLDRGLTLYQPLGRFEPRSGSQATQLQEGHGMTEWGIVDRRPDHGHQTQHGVARTRMSGMQT